MITKNKILWRNKQKIYNVRYYNMQYQKKIITSAKSIL